jgi:hypothetical protein
MANYHFRFSPEESSVQAVHCMGCDTHFHCWDRFERFRLTECLTCLGQCVGDRMSFEVSQTIRDLRAAIDRPDYVTPQLLAAAANHLATLLAVLKRTQAATSEQPSATQAQDPSDPTDA